MKLFLKRSNESFLEIDSCEDEERNFRAQDRVGLGFRLSFRRTWTKLRQRPDSPNDPFPKTEFGALEACLFIYNLCHC